MAVEMCSRLQLLAPRCSPLKCLTPGAPAAPPRHALGGCDPWWCPCVCSAVWLWLHAPLNQLLPHCCRTPVFPALQEIPVLVASFAQSLSEVLDPQGVCGLLGVCSGEGLAQVSRQAS